MMKILFVIVTCILFCSCYHTYTPTFFDGDKLYTSKDSLTAEHRKNIQKVFKYHNVSFKLEGDQILYKGFIDDELIWNYTSKANDTAWMRINGH